MLGSGLTANFYKTQMITIHVNVIKQILKIAIPIHALEVDPQFHWKLERVQTVWNSWYEVVVMCYMIFVDRFWLYVGICIYQIDINYKLGIFSWIASWFVIEVGATAGILTIRWIQWTYKHFSIDLLPTLHNKALKEFRTSIDNSRKFSSFNNRSNCVEFLVIDLNGR